MATLTLNQVRDRMRSLALSHKQIKWFYFGDPWEFDQQEKTIDYPACFVESLPGVVDRINRVQRFNFKVYLLDLVKVVQDTEGNETEVLSDMSSVAADYLSMLMAPAYQFSWDVAETSNVSPLTETLGDMTAGVTVEVGISVEFAADLCQVPADEVVFGDILTVSRTKIIKYTGTASETATITVADLAGKTVLAVFRAGFYKRAITTTPTDSEKVKITGTDLGDGKGILASTGTVALQTGDALIENEVLDFLVWSV